MRPAISNVTASPRRPYNAMQRARPGEPPLRQQHQYTSITELSPGSIVNFTFPHFLQSCRKCFRSYVIYNTMPILSMNTNGVWDMLCKYASFNLICTVHRTIVYHTSIYEVMWVGQICSRIENRLRVFHAIERSKIFDICSNVMRAAKSGPPVRFAGVRHSWQMANILLWLSSAFASIPVALAQPRRSTCYL